MQKKIVVLFSGGLDSYIALRRALTLHEPRDVMALNIDLGHPYAGKERNAILRLADNLPPVFQFMSVDLIRDAFGNVPTPERQVIPGRNLIFANLAASFGEEIWLSALQDEQHDHLPSEMSERLSRGQRDKTEEFFKQTTRLLTYTFAVLREETRLVTPFARETKAEAVAWALRNGVTAEELVKTSTCYHPTDVKCGQCSTCFKRWVALECNHVRETYDRDARPWTSEPARAYVEAYRQALIAEDYSHYSRKRIAEAARAMANVGEPALLHRALEARQGEVSRYPGIAAMWGEGNRGYWLDDSRP